MILDWSETPSRALKYSEQWNRKTQHCASSLANLLGHEKVLNGSRSCCWCRTLGRDLVEGCRKLLDLGVHLLGTLPLLSEVTSLSKEHVLEAF